MAAQTQSLPRFIQTQRGDFVSVAHVMAFRVSVIGDQFNVVADLTPELDFYIGQYDSETDASVALEIIVQDIVIGERSFIGAPSRNFRSVEVED